MPAPLPTRSRPSSGVTAPPPPAPSASTAPPPCTTSATSAGPCPARPSPPPSPPPSTGGTGPDAVLLPATYDGRDIAGRLSVKLDRPVLTNVVGLSEVDGGLASQHAIFGGAEILTAKFTAEGPGIFVIRAKSFAAEPSGGAAAAVVAAPAPDTGASNAARIVARHVEERTGPKLDEAAVVVSGGRGLGEKEQYVLIEQLAGLLHGAAGPAGPSWMPAGSPTPTRSAQTGKTVKPTVYMACGISGATQHMVGMKNSKNIVAINKDQDAPIFQVADLGIVGDVHKVIPKLIEALQARADPRGHPASVPGRQRWYGVGHDPRLRLRVVSRGRPAPLKPAGRTGPSGARGSPDGGDPPDSVRSGAPVRGRGRSPPVRTPARTTVPCSFPPSTSPSSSPWCSRCSGS